MRVFKCDRCKNYIDEEHKMYKVKCESLVPAEYDARRNKVIDNYKAYEVCDKCANAIEKFIVNPNYTKGDNNDL